jgi:hypothetical protein
LTALFSAIIVLISYAFMLCTLRTALLVTVASLLFTPALSNAQDLGDELENIGEVYADGYVQPLTDAFGSDLSGGLFRTADVGNGFLPGLPFDVYVGASVSSALLSDDNDQFTFEGEQITSGGRTLNVTATSPDNQVPTVFGDTNPNGELVFRDAQTGIEVDRQPIPPALVSASIAPLPVPQIGLGSIAGTDVQVRFLPKTDISDYGSVGLTGVAVRHDVDQWVPAPLPFNIAAQGAWNQITIDDSDDSEVMDASGWAVNVQASKGVPVLPLVLYGGLQYESFDVDYNYTFEGPQGGTNEISLSQDAATSTRALAGFSLTLAIIRINVDYAVTNGNNVVTGGFGLRL